MKCANEAWKIPGDVEAVWNKRFPRFLSMLHQFWLLYRSNDLKFSIQKKSPQAHSASAVITTNIPLIPSKGATWSGWAFLPEADGEKGMSLKLDKSEVRYILVNRYADDTGWEQMGSNDLIRFLAQCFYDKDLFPNCASRPPSVDRNAIGDLCSTMGD